MGFRRSVPIAWRAALAATVTAMLLIPVRPAAAAELEVKGIWLRPVASLTSATRQLDNIQKAGFNTVYLETFYHGFTIYPGSPYVPIRPEMAGTDYLKFYIEQGKKRGLETHAWIEVFYWAVDTEKYPQFPRTPLFDEHPDWKAVLRNGKTTEYAETAHIFANPARPEVREFLTAFMQELLQRYDLAGLNLDYIRYPDGSPDAGYSEYTRARYKESTGIDPITIEKDPNSKQWRDWVEWREEQVLTMVRMIKAMKEKVKPDVVLSAAIFPGSKSERYTNNKFQNWREMLKQQLLDAIIPMAYAYDVAEIERSLERVEESISEGSGIGLLPVVAVQRKTVDWYSGQGHPPVSKKMALVKKMGLPGFSVFCYDWMMDSEEGLDLLKEN
jgi:uncharacterized lipoprotein YddW (UPF0748 family)